MIIQNANLTEKLKKGAKTIGFGSFGTPGQIRTADLSLRSEVEPMNRRVPQYPYTFYCEILTQNGL